MTTTITAIATGTVTFYDGGVQIGSAQPLAEDAAAVTTATLALGTHSITAAYSGDATYAGSTSPAVPELIANAEFTIAPDPASPAGSTTQTVAPGPACCRDDGGGGRLRGGAEYAFRLRFGQRLFWQPADHVHDPGGWHNEWARRGTLQKLTSVRLIVE